MATPTNHWKLGLFVLLGGVVTLTTVGVLGVRSLRNETGSYVTYFDESVQGLEVGSPIKFRGVTIGTVGKIDVAPDHRHVEVTSDLGKAVLNRLGLDVASALTPVGAPKKLVQAIDLRVQLSSSGLTGVKFLELDFFTVADHPRPKLPFPVPKNYIPATDSTMKYLQASVVRTMNSLPQITLQVSGVLDSVDKLLREAAEQKLIEKAAATVVATRHLVKQTQRKVARLDTARLSAEVAQTLAATRGLVGQAQRKLAQLEPGRLSTKLEETLAGFNSTATRVNAILARIDGSKGLLASVLRASNAFGDTARTADGLGGQLESTLRAVQEAARSIRMLGGALEKEPDMLVKGREKQP
jgi:phospholipid/cholesterol/gamma-HCH transport system substrate-binding protein